MKPTGRSAPGFTPRRARAPWLAAGVILAGVSLAMIVDSVQPALASDDPSQAMITLYPQTPSEGERVYAEQCSLCHGADGAGGAGPALTTSTQTDAERLAAIADGLGSMPAFGASLSAGELDAVASFIAGLAAATTPVTDPGTGSEVFSQRCAECHGADGSGGVGPALIGTRLSADELTSVIRTGRGSMPPFGSSLFADEMVALVDYVAGLGAPPPPPDPAQVAAGADIYERECAVCHGPDATGDIGLPLRQLILSEEESVSVIFNGRRDMPSFGGVLSDQEIANVAAYLRTLGEAVTTTTQAPLRSGAEIFADRCVECHNADGSGGIGPSLWTSRLSNNEIVSRVYGGHMSDMPAFKLALSASEVQAVARFTESLQTGEVDGPSLFRIALFATIGIVVVGVALVMWARMRRSRS